MSTRNLLGGKGRPMRKIDNFTAICEPIVMKMWEHRRLTTLWASTACYKDFFIYSVNLKRSSGTISICRNIQIFTAESWPDGWTVVPTSLFKRSSSSNCKYRLLHKQLSPLRLGHERKSDLLLKSWINFKPRPYGVNDIKLSFFNRRSIRIKFASQTTQKSVYFYFVSTV
jgi:hypothetical protein